MDIILKSLPTKLLTVAMLLVVTGCSEKQEQVQVDASPRPVKLITIAGAGDARTLTYPATIDAVQISRLAFQVSGKLEQLNVIAAQEVVQGEQLASLEKRTFNNQLSSANAQFKTALSDYERGKILARDDVISARELEQLKSKKDVAASAYDSAKKALSDSTLVAPYDAVIAAVAVKNFENVNSGQHIVTLFGRGQMEAIVNIPASIVATVDTTNDRQVFVILESLPDTPIHATFRRANLEADAASQTYEVRFAFTPPEGLNILPGMNASLRIVMSGNRTAKTTMVSVPLFAIFQENNQHYVWKVNGKDMAVQKAPVKIKQGIGEEIIVTQGLDIGDIIVGAGANYLTEGIVVRPWTKS